MTDAPLSTILASSSSGSESMSHGNAQLILTTASVPSATSGLSMLGVGTYTCDMSITCSE